MALNRADECLQRADECRHSAAQVADDVLRDTYLDLARRWRVKLKLGLAQQLWQLGDVHRNPSRLIAREELGRPPNLRIIISPARGSDN